MTHSRRSGAATRALCLIAALPVLAGCSYVERARQGTDLVVGVASGTSWKHWSRRISSANACALPAA